MYATFKYEGKKYKFLWRDVYFHNKPIALPDNRVLKVKSWIDIWPSNPVPDKIEHIMYILPISRAIKAEEYK